MKIALKTSAFAPVFALAFLALAATASATLSTPRSHHHDASCAASDPEPADCPFCGGNPVVHVQRIQALEHTSMAVLARLLR